MREFRTGLLLTKVSDTHVYECFLKHLNFPAEIYRQGGHYDLVFAYNLTSELKHVRKHTGAKILAIAAEPWNQLQSNYACDLVSLCDIYYSYSKPDCPEFCGEHNHYTYPAFETAYFDAIFEKAVATPKEYDFCMFARHDPNCRLQMAKILEGKSAYCAGPLFQNPVESKLEIQFRSRFEFITENEITESYVSEKLGQSLMAGCVPVYLGGARAHELFPGNLFIDVRHFASLEEVLAFCLSPGVYDDFAARIRENAPAVLLEKHTWESNVIGSLLNYRSRLIAAGFRSSGESIWWKTQWLKRHLGAVRRWMKRSVQNCTK